MSALFATGSLGVHCLPGKTAGFKTCSRSPPISLPDKITQQDEGGTEHEHIPRSLCRSKQLLSAAQKQVLLLKVHAVPHLISI